MKKFLLSLLALCSLVGLSTFSQAKGVYESYHDLIENTLSMLDDEYGMGLLDEEQCLTITSLDSMSCNEESTNSSNQVAIGIKGWLGADDPLDYPRMGNICRIGVLSCKAPPQPIGSPCYCIDLDPFKNFSGVITTH